jgi:hypothetical protein
MSKILFAHYLHTRIHMTAAAGMEPGSHMRTAAAVVDIVAPHRQEVALLAALERVCRMQVPGRMIAVAVHMSEQVDHTAAVVPAVDRIVLAGVVHRDFAHKGIVVCAARKDLVQDIETLLRRVQAQRDCSMKGR